MVAFYVAAALVSGAGLALQVGLNNELRSRLGHPIAAAVASFAIGLVALLLAAAPLRPSLPPAAELRRGPWWMWFGGIVGAVYVGCSAAFARRLGAAGWLGLIIAGQLLTSLVLDHYGLISFPRQPVSP